MSLQPIQRSIPEVVERLRKRADDLQACMSEPDASLDEVLHYFSMQAELYDALAVIHALANKAHAESVLVLQ